MNFLHIPGQGLGVLLIRIFIKTEIRSFWVRTPKAARKQLLEEVQRKTGLDNKHSIGSDTSRREFQSQGELR